MEKRATLTVKIFDPETKAARAAQKAVLEEIYLVDAKTWRDPLVSSPEVLALEHKFAREILFPEEYEYNLGLHFILCKFRVAAFNDKSPNKPVMKIEATFYTSFSEANDPDVPTVDLDSPVDENSAYSTYMRFIYTVNPISAAWPYWREFVQNMSTRMGYPALTVPMLEIVFKNEPEKKAKNHVTKKDSLQRKKTSA